MVREKPSLDRTLLELQDRIVDLLQGQPPVVDLAVSSHSVHIMTMILTSHCCRACRQHTCLMYDFLFLGHRGASHGRIISRSRSTVSDRRRAPCLHGEIDRKGRNVEVDWRRRWCKSRMSGRATPTKHTHSELHNNKAMQEKYPETSFFITFDSFSVFPWEVVPDTE